MKNYIKQKWDSFKFNYDWLLVYFSPFKPFLPTLYVGKVGIGVPYFLPRKKVKIQKNIYRFDKRKFGFDFCTLGWKTKWTKEDIRHEWNPVWSFVFFGFQVALIFNPNFYEKHLACHYWECYLFYSKYTDKTKSVEERLKYAIKNFPQTWIHSSNGKEVKTNYWKIILKDKYLKLIE